MNLNVETNLHDAFKASTAAQGKKMTDILIEFIRDYVQKHPPQSPKRSQKELGTQRLNSCVSHLRRSIPS
jgi:hypothetical protein